MANKTPVRRRTTEDLDPFVDGPPEPVAKPKSKNDQLREELINALADVGGRLTAEEDIIFKGTQLILPESMSGNLKEAIDFLKEKRDEDEREVQYQKIFKYRPYDGAHATHLALKKAFGMMSQRSTWHWWGEEPPSLITVDVGIDETEQVPWGAVGVPLLPGVTLYLNATKDPELGTIFALTANGPRKFRHHIEGIFRLVEDELANNSMYRAKAFDGQEHPKFVDLRGFDESKVIYSEDVLAQLDANVWSVLRYSDKLAALGIPLKRAVLLEGPFGSGKTLAAQWTATVALENKWTFITCRPARDDLFEVMQTARLYQPSVVFFEDVDTIADPNSTERDDVSQLLDVFDGIQAKDTRIVVVLTTNHVERIHKGMIRPGRLDAVIHIGELDAAGFEKLVKVVVPAEHLGDVDYDVVAKAFEDFLPAFAREAIDRAVRYSVARNKGEAGVLETADFVHAADGLRPQLELMNDAKEVGTSDPMEKRFKALIDDRLNETAMTYADPDDGIMGHLISATPNGN